MPAKSSKSRKNIALYTCRHCFKTWRKEKIFKKHLKVCSKSSAPQTPPKYRCRECGKYFTYITSFQRHACKKLKVLVCPLCKKDYTHRKCFRKHVRLCCDVNGRSSRKKKRCKSCKKVYLDCKPFLNKHLGGECSRRTDWLKSYGFRLSTDSDRRSKIVCITCSKSYFKNKWCNMVFHRCDVGTKDKLDGLYTKVLLDRKGAGRGCTCFSCGKVFPTAEKCSTHYKQKFCKRQTGTSRRGEKYKFYKCNFCGKFYALFSMFRRHLRSHTYDREIMKKIRVGGMLMGGGNLPTRRSGRLRNRRQGKAGVGNDTAGPSSRQGNHDEASSDSDDSGDGTPPLAGHVLGREAPLLPARWGWTEHTINLNAPNFDGEFLRGLLLRETKSQILERRRMLHEEIHDNGDGVSQPYEDELFKNDVRYSTLSMTVTLKVFFYKMNLGMNLGQTSQQEKRRKPLPTETDKSHDVDETIIESYFHSHPVRLLAGNLKAELLFIVESFAEQIEEYTTLKSGLRLFQVSQCMLQFYSYQSMAGSGGEEVIPSHCYMTIHGLYADGKVLHLSYENVRSHISIGRPDVYTSNCFLHVLAAFNYLKLGYESTHIPTSYEACTGFILNRYLQIRVTDVMDVEESVQSLKGYDFSMCRNNGRPMELQDIPVFYARNYEKDKGFPIINIFKLDYVDGLDDVLLPKGSETVGDSMRKYVITQYFLSRDFEDDATEGRDVINVLYWKETNHYYLIANLKAVVLCVNFDSSFRRRNHQKLCYVCMNMIDVRHVSMKEHVDFCKSRTKKQHVSYPSEGKNVEKFESFRLMNKLLFFVSADAECSLQPIAEPDRSFLDDRYAVDQPSLNKKINCSLYENAYKSQNFPLNGSSSGSQPVHAHRLNSIGWQLYVSPDVTDFPHKKFTDEIGDFMQVLLAQADDESEEERLVDAFMDWLNKASVFIRMWLMEVNDEDRQKGVLKEMKKHHQRMIRNSTHCIYCKKQLDKPVLDHCHLTNVVRGMACNKCNLLARNEAWDNFRLQVYFHNFSSYDSSFIVRYMKNPICTTGQPRSRKDLWKCRMKGNKIRRLCTALLDFRDSLDIIPVSIGCLSENLPVSEMDYVNEIRWQDEEVSKNIYPYQWFVGVECFGEVSFPSLDEFESRLTGKITRKDYEYSKKLYETNCKRFVDWHVHYLQMDFKILLDALIYWQRCIYNDFGIDLLKCQSLPSCAKQSLLKLSGVELELITDPSIHSTFQASIKGGLCVSALRSHRVTNHALESIRYFDIKSLYASIQKLYPHPVSGYSYVTPIPTPEDLTAMALAFDDKTSDTGYLCVVDLKIPRELHSLLSDFPVTYEKMSVDSSLYPPTSKWHHLPKSRVPKLIPSLLDPKNYSVSMFTLRFLVRLGLIVVKVHRVIAFKQGYFLREFIDICMEKRKKSGLKMDNVTYKMIPNSGFGKFIENAFLYTDTRFIFNKNDYERIVRDASRFIGAKFEKYGVLMRSRCSTVRMNKAHAVGWSILCKSKTHFQEMYYYRILPSYMKIARPITRKNRLRCMYVDTDSIILKLSLDSEEEMEFYSLLRDIFDFSTLSVNDRFYSDENLSVVGVFKDECPGLLIRSMHSNGAKSYVYTIENTTGIVKELMTEKERKLYYPFIKMKALSKYFQSTLLSEDDFLRAFDQPYKERYITYTTLRMGYERRMYTFKCTRKILDSHDSKRYVFPDQRDSLALGHYLTMNEDWVRMMMEQSNRGLGSSDVVW